MALVPIWLKRLTNAALGPPPIRAAGAKPRGHEYEKETRACRWKFSSDEGIWLRNIGVGIRYGK